MNGFHCFPIQVKVSCHFFDGHHQTEKKNVLSQSGGDSFPGIDTVQLFNGISTGWTFHGSVSNPQNRLRIKTIEISHHPFMIGMDPFHFVLTVMTDWVIAFIWLDGQGYHLFFWIKRLVFHGDSTKIKEWIKLYLGHRFASSGLFLVMQILYPEKQAVSIFISLFYQVFGRRT